MLQKLASYIIFGSFEYAVDAVGSNSPLDFAAKVSGEALFLPIVIVVLILSTVINFLSRIFAVTIKVLALTFRGEFMGLFSSKSRLPPRVQVPVIEEDVVTSTSRPNALYDIIDRDKKLIHCFASADGKYLASVPLLDAKQVNERVQKAKEAQQQWKTVSFQEHDIVWASCVDTGKTRVDAMLGEIITTLEKIRWLCAEGEAVLSPERRSVGPLTLHKVARVEYHPLGVIGAIAPWNYPFHNIYNPLLAALFSGNAFVAKPSEYTCWSSQFFVSVMRHVLEYCGHSPELVQLVTGDSTTGEALIKSEGIDKIFFTGSTKVGKLVASQAAEQLKPIVLELGGKDPFIVLKDADIEQAIELLMRGVFQNSGQNCVGIERVFVHRNVMEQFERRVVSEVSKLRVGNDLSKTEACIDLGAMTMGTTSVRNIQRLVESAVEQGAELLYGEIPSVKEIGPCFVKPIVLGSVSKDMRIMHEEVFGPVVVLMPFHDEQDLVNLVNLCPFGLGSSIFSRDIVRANRISAQLQCGMCNINDFGVNYLCQSLPFGGTKASGSDRFSGPEGLRGCCLVKAVTWDRIPRVRTRIPKPLKYPVQSNGYEFTRSLVVVLYEESQISRLGAVWRLLKAAMNQRQ
eukprot:jgi/Galph1/422/GphlegSOOS_G5237.1